MQRSLRDVLWKGKWLIFRDEYPDMCPPVISHGYAFKPYAMKQAVELGSRYLIWADAAVWAIAPIEPVFRRIVEDGHLFFYNGYPVGEWCRDTSLSKLGLTREEAFAIPEITSSFFGLDMESDGGKKFLEGWTAYANDGETFIVNPNTNDKGQCSKDSRVRGHRYDQTAASVLVQRLGMKKTHCPEFYAYFQNKTEKTIFVNRGL